MVSAMGKRSDASQGQGKKFGLEGRRTAFKILKSRTAVERGRAELYVAGADRQHRMPAYGNMPLQGRRNWTTSNGMTITREEIDAKIAASEARTDTRLAEMSGKFDLMISKIDSLHNDLSRTEKRVENAKWTMVAVVIGAVLAGAGLLASGVGIGSAFREIVRQEVQATATPAASLPAAPPAPSEQ